MLTCWTCAKIYDPKVTFSPTHYCSSVCADIGARPYSRGPIENKLKSFAIKLINKLHYLQHNNDDRHDCESDLCMEAKILGL